MKNLKIRAVLEKRNALGELKDVYVTEGFGNESNMLSYLFEAYGEAPGVRFIDEVTTSNRFIESGKDWQGWAIVEYLMYTGLKDKNQKEIYEGDTIKVKGYGVGTVVFRQGSFMVEWVADEAYSMELSLILWKSRSDEEVPFEVLGNIYENQELLEEIRRETKE